jgi:hypothetical protein
LAASQKAGVIRDVVVSKLGTEHHKDFLKRPVRLIIVRRQKSNGETEELWLVTDRLQLDADLVALAYRYRWTVELFFAGSSAPWDVGTCCSRMPTVWHCRPMRPDRQYADRPVDRT